jgi:general secretion pathway protein D
VKIRPIILLIAIPILSIGIAAPKASAQDQSSEEGIRLNFRGVPLDTVLDYLSRSAGFVIVREAVIEGTVDVWSHQPLTKDEAVDLLNTILNQKGYAAIRNDRTLIIVTLEEAREHDLPVVAGSDSTKIPKTDEMVTQIIPVRYANVSQLVQAMEPLLPSHAIVTANEGSNAIILTDTSKSIHRMVEIVEALDTPISSVAALRVFVLEYSESAETAKLINDLFAASSANTTSFRDRQRQAFFQRFQQRGSSGGRGRFPFGGDQGRGGNRGTTAEGAETRQAMSRVLAVADERTNAVVVSAPEDVMPTIEQMIAELDTDTAAVPEVRVFPLKFALAEDMVDIILEAFVPQNVSRGTGGGGGRGGQQGRGGSTALEDEDIVQAVADARTNSVVVSSMGDKMILIAKMIASLDSDPALTQRVFVYDLKNANPETVAAILEGMFGEGASGGNTAGSNPRGGQGGQARQTGQGNRNQGTRGGGGGRQ